MKMVMYKFYREEAFVLDSDDYDSVEDMEEDGIEHFNDYVHREDDEVHIEKVTKK